MTFDDMVGAIYIEVDHSKPYKVSKEINDEVCYDVDIDGGLRGVEILGVDSIELERYVYEEGEDLSDINREIKTEKIAKLYNKGRKQWKNN